MHTLNKYWIIVASKDHVARGVEGSFCQANHGKAGNLKRMKKGDGLLFYSSKESYEEKTPYQKFTAIGEVLDDELYQGIMSSDFTPFRRNVQFFRSKEVAIHPLLEQLSFIQDKKRWGYTFRFGFLEIPKADFFCIAKEMHVHAQDLFRELENEQ